MIDLLVSGKTRIKLLLKLFLVPGVNGYLRGLADESGMSTNAIRLELDRFEKAGLLKSGMEQNRKVFFANTDHPLFPDIISILRKHVGVDLVVEQVIDRIGNVTQAYLTGELAVGRDSQQIDLVVVGDEINKENLMHLATKAEKLVHRKISCTILTLCEAEDWLKGRNDLWKIWG